MSRLAYLAERQAVITAAQGLLTHGLARGTAGNVSQRAGDGYLITPTGMTYEALLPADIVWLPFSADGDRADGAAAGGAPRRASSEWRFHRDILRARPEIGAIVHGHPSYATALSCLEREIPAFHYMVAVAGGDSIPLAAYGTFGSQALSDNALAALEGRLACLLSHHGMIALGKDAPAALALGVEVETLAEQYCHALAVGTPPLLSGDEMRVVIEKFRGYGRQKE